MHRPTKFDVLAHAQARLPARAPGSSPQAAHRDVPAVPDRSPLLTALWPLLWRFHFFAGVVVAPFLVVLCLTGIAYALAPQLSEVVYHEQLSVDRVGRRPESLAVQVRAAQAVEPHRRLASIDPPSAPDRTTAVNFATGSRTASGLDEYRTVYVDPYTGSTHGALTTTAGAAAAAGVAARAPRPAAPGRRGPRLLRAGRELAAVSGLGRAAALADPGAGVAGRTRSCRAAASAGLLFISVTGLTWSHFAGARFEALVDALHGSTPEITAQAPAHAAGAPQIGPDAALRRARAEGLTGPVEVTPPAGRSGTYVVGEISDSWPIRQDRVALDPHTGATVQRLDFASYPLAAKLTTLGIDAHQGTLLGPLNQLVLIVFALGLLFVAGAGYRMWGLRRPAGAILGRAPARGAWRRLPRVAVVAGAVAAVAIGVALPVFGGSLAVFLLLDTLAGRVLGER